MKVLEGLRRWKVQKTRLKSHGHVLRKEDECVYKRVMLMEVPGQRRKCIPKRRWLDTIRNDLTVRDKLLSGEEAQEWAKWRRLKETSTPHKSGKGCGRRIIIYSWLQLLDATCQACIDNQSIFVRIYSVEPPRFQSIGSSSNSNWKW